MSTLSTFKLPACPDTLSIEQIEQFWRDGYLAFSDVLSADEVQSAREALAELVRVLMAQAEAQQNESIWKMPDSKLLFQFESGYSPLGATPDELELKVRKLMWYQDQHPAFSTLTSTHKKLRELRESILGTGAILFQDMALIKPPFIGSEKPWHQDNAYFSVTPLESVAGIWIALDDATVENGCMHVIPGAHKNGALRHFIGNDCEILRDRLQLEAVVPVELPAGGAMIFSGMLPHQTPPNSSPERRRALQFHYRAAHSTIVPKPEYFKIFAEPDGTPASCAAAVQNAI